MFMNLLKEYLNCFLSEGAISVAQAAQEGLAAIVTQELSGHEITLFRPDVLMAMIKDGASTKELVWGNEEFVVGSITFAKPTKGQCHNANEVSSPVAVKGYGPLLYDLAMSMSPALIPDRYGDTTHSAQNIWNYYKNNRSDISHRPLDDIYSPKTPPKDDDCEVIDGPDFLNYAYSGASVDIGPLVNNYNNFMDQVTPLLKKMKIPPGILGTVIERAGAEFFRSKYSPN